MPLCSVWIVNKFVNNSFEKKESKKIFTRIIWGLFILIQIVMETEKGNVSIQKGIISFFVILGIIIIGYKGTFQRKLLFTSLFISIWILSEFFVYFILNISKKLAAITFITIPVLYLINFIFHRKVYLINQKIRQFTDKYYSFLNDSLSEIISIKTFGLEKDISKQILSRT